MECCWVSGIDPKLLLIHSTVRFFNCKCPGAAEFCTVEASCLGIFGNEGHNLRRSVRETYSERYRNNLANPGPILNTEAFILQR